MRPCRPHPVLTEDVEAPELRRLGWRCRRGLLELDIILGCFLEREGATMNSDELAQLGVLLRSSEIDLLDILLGRSDNFDSSLKSLVTRLRRS
jgi:succinate dehydrogenase flavin-adding protein (antitoxin of CptAB toxin-antitoxin module)